MSQKLIPEAEAAQRMAEAIRDSKRRFTIQNSAHGTLTFEHEARFALEAVHNSAQLLKCDPSSLADSMVHLAAMGLSLNPTSQQAALIPRWNSKRGVVVVTASPMFRGLMKLATDTGLITNISANVVFQCEEDSFDVDLGSNPYLKHKPKLFAPPEDRVIDLINLERNRMIGCYCIAELRDSNKPDICVMDLTDALSIAGASDAFNPRKPDAKPYGPWVYWAGEMLKKAVIRRASKQWPISSDEKYQRLLTAVEIDNEAERNEQRTEVRADEVEAELGATISAEQAAKIKDLCETQNLPTEQVFKTYSVNSLSKIKLKFFPEIEEKLLVRQRKYNASMKAQAGVGEDKVAE